MREKSGEARDKKKKKKPSYSVWRKRPPLGRIGTRLRLGERIEAACRERQGGFPRSIDLRPIIKALLLKGYLLIEASSGGKIRKKRREDEETGGSERASIRKSSPEAKGDRRGFPPVRAGREKKSYKRKR